jgi:hypothetical protein
MHESEESSSGMWEPRFTVATIALRLLVSNAIVAIEQMAE